MELTNVEQLAIEELKKVAKIWPKSLWLFSYNGTLHVMKRDKGIHRVDQQSIVGIIDIESGGGNFP